MKQNKSVHVGCGGGYERINNVPFPLPDGRPQFRCSKCGQTWTEGVDGGRSLSNLKEKVKISR